MLWTRRQDGAVLPSERAASGTTLQRRGALAGFAVVLAGLMAKVSELPARAADGQPLLLGRSNQADSPTQLDRTSTVNNDGAALVVTNSTGPAIQGSGVGDNPINAGVTGFGEGVLSYGVHGVGGAIGVFGETNSPNGDAGVLGSGRNSGVTGRSPNGTGVIGSGSNGIFGVANTSGGNGVVGQGAPGGAGVFGQAGQGPQPDTYGVFSAGRFGATGPITALIPSTDGVQRVVFDTAGPDSLIIDIGSATLDLHGHATVPLAPDFAALIDTSTYQVFVTPYAESEGLFVGRRTPTSFDVASHHGGREANIAFGWQVVGKRKDIAVSRPVTAEVQPTPPTKP
jgi:hypothetical protein